MIALSVSLKKKKKHSIELSNSTKDSRRHFDLSNGGIDSIIWIQVAWDSLLFKCVQPLTLYINLESYGDFLFLFLFILIAFCIPIRDSNA